MRPVAGGTRPRTTFRKVVLPPPFGPMTVTISPGPMAKSTSDSTVRPPRRTETADRATSGRTASAAGTAAFPVMGVSSIADTFDISPGRRQGIGWIRNGRIGAAAGDHDMTRHRILVALAALAGLAVPLAGAARADPPRVVATIAPVHSLVAQVMRGVGEPVLLLPPEVSEHDYAMKPSDARAIADADL